MCSFDIIAHSSFVAVQQSVNESHFQRFQREGESVDDTMAGESSCARANNDDETKDTLSLPYPCVDAKILTVMLR
jgi:hypothetical protein